MLYTRSMIEPKSVCLRLDLLNIPAILCMIQWAEKGLVTGEMGTEYGHLSVGVKMLPILSQLISVPRGSNNRIFTVCRAM
jgi:hypothetical protein